MSKPEIDELDSWNWPDYAWEPDGYDRKQVPLPTTDNIVLLQDKVNELVRAINELRGEE